MNMSKYALYCKKISNFSVSCYSANKWPVSSILVVKLFNAVSKHQKEMESKLKSASTEAKKSKGERLQVCRPQVGPLPGFRSLTSLEILNFV